MATSPRGGLPSWGTASATQWVTRTGGGQVASFSDTTDSASYTYDALGELTGVDNSVRTDQSYEYDANGNPTGEGYVIGAENRLLADPGHTYEYDAEGNRTLSTDLASGEVTQYEWDFRNRLTGVDVRAADGTLLRSVSYTYDALNRLVGRTQTDGTGAVVSEEQYALETRDLASPTATAGATSQTALDQVSAVIGADGLVTERYLWGSHTDEVLAEETAAGETLWLLGDDLGSVRAVAEYDAVTGQTSVVKRVSYDAFGAVASDSDPSVAVRFGYTGLSLDSATGLQSNRARWYDPTARRWVSEDPKGFDAGDANLGRYVGNDPLNATDPSGLDAWWNDYVPTWNDL